MILSCIAESSGAGERLADSENTCLFNVIESLSNPGGCTKHDELIYFFLKHSAIMLVFSAFLSVTEIFMAEFLKTTF